MLQLRSLHAEIGQLSLHTIKLRFCLRDVQIGRNADIVSITRQSQILPIRHLGSTKQIDLRVDAMDIEIVLRELRLIEQLRVFENRLLSLREILTRGNSPPDAAPTDPAPMKR